MHIVYSYISIYTLCRTTQDHNVEQARVKNRKLAVLLALRHLHGFVLRRQAEARGLELYFAAGILLMIEILHDPTHDIVHCQILQGHARFLSATVWAKFVLLGLVGVVVMPSWGSGMRMCMYVYIYMHMDIYVYISRYIHGGQHASDNFLVPD